MDSNEIVNIVDGFMSLGLLSYMLWHQLKITNQLRSDNNSIRDKQILDVKSANEQHVLLLEKCLDALNQNRSFLESHIIGLDDRIAERVSREVKNAK